MNWTVLLPKDTLKSYPPVPQKVTIFGKRIFRGKLKWWAPIQYDWCACKQVKLGHKDRQAQREDSVKTCREKMAMWLEWWVYKPMNASDCLQMPEAGRVRKGSPLELSEHDFADTLILGRYRYSLLAFITSLTGDITESFLGFFFNDLWTWQNFMFLRKQTNKKPHRFRVSPLC